MKTTASETQIAANRLNAEKSTGPVTESGREASSHNRGTHFLSNNADFRVLAGEDATLYNFFLDQLLEDYKPNAPAESALVVRMAEHEWMRRRALRYMDEMFHCDPNFSDPLLRNTHQPFALMMRYHSLHEKAFYNALNMLLKLRAESKKDKIGFERKAAQADALERQKQKHLSSEKAKQIAAECLIIRTLRTSANIPEALQLARDVQTRHQAA